MSVVTLQLGQCGNQVGSAFFDGLFEEACTAGPGSFQESTFETFFREAEPTPSSSAANDSPSFAPSRLTARAVLIDMEPKVITAVMRSAAQAKSAATGPGARAQWLYGADSHFAQDSGAGNNWARGYFSYGPKCRSAIFDIIRREVEACDCFGGFLTLQSMAGGTGAGLGAYVIDALREEYGAAPVLSHCVWPFESGEVIVQCYNALLTMRHLSESADGIVLVENEALAAVCRRQLHLARPGFDDLNRLAARALASIALPARWRPTGTAGPGDRCGGAAVPGTRVRLLSDLISCVCPHPGYKLLSLRSIPQIPPASVDFTTFTWPSILRRLRQMVLMGSPVDDSTLDWAGLGIGEGAGPSAAPSPPLPNRVLPQPVEGVPFSGRPVTSITRPVNRSTASLLVLRGKGSAVADVSGLADPALYAAWAVDPLQVASQATQLGNYEMAAGLLSNCQSTVSPARRALSKAYDMHSSQAYVHQYYQHGMQEREFVEAFVTLEDIIGRYQMM